MSTETTQQVAPNFNDILIQNVAGLSEWIKTSAGQVGNFVSEQTPLFIQEYLNWYFWDHAVTVGIFVILYIIVASLLLCNKKEFVRSWDEDKMNVGTFIFMAAGIVGVIGFIPFFFDGVPAAKEMVKVKVAPRIVLVEKIADLTKRLK